MIKVSGVKVYVTMQPDPSTATWFKVVDPFGRTPGFVHQNDINAIIPEGCKLYACQDYRLVYHHQEHV